MVFGWIWTINVGSFLVEKIYTTLVSDVDNEVGYGRGGGAGSIWEISFNFVITLKLLFKKQICIENWDISGQN